MIEKIWHLTQKRFATPLHNVFRTKCSFLQDNNRIFSIKIINAIKGYLVEWFLISFISE